MYHDWPPLGVPPRPEHRWYEDGDEGTLRSATFMFLSDSVFSTYANYPLSVFGSVLAWLFTFLVPLAFVA